jgi:hypothetical protein
MNPIALAFVTLIWCTFKMFPLEAKIVIQVERFLRKNLSNHKKCDPKFRVAMDLVQGWVATISLLGLNMEDIKFTMDFENILLDATFVAI